MKRKIVIAVGVAIFATVLGFGLYKSDASPASPKLSTDDIKQLVTAQYPGEIAEIELEKELNKAVYEVEVISNGKEYDLKLDGNTGEVLKLKEKTVKNKEQIALSDDSDHDDDKIESGSEQGRLEKEPNKSNESSNENKKETENKPTLENKKTVIDANKAMEIALKEFPGTVTDLELDEDDGRLIYEIEIKNGKEEADFEIDAYTGDILVIEMDTDDN